MVSKGNMYILHVFLLLPFFCASALEPGSPCTTDVDCGFLTSFMTCDLTVPGQGKCVCSPSPSTTIFDYATTRCLLKANEECSQLIDAQSCVLHSTCQKLLPTDVSAICKCNGGRTPNADGQCRVSYGGGCGQTADCDPHQFTTCNPRTGECDCESPLHESVWSPTEGQCRILASQPCSDVPATGQWCVPFATCKYVAAGTGAGNFFCVCDNGLMQSQSRHCVLPHGAPCIGDPGEPTCDQERFQQCDGGKCGCKDSFNSWYDPPTKSCFLLERSPCDPSNSPDRQLCAPNSICSPDTSAAGGTCTCTNGLRPNPERRCYLGLGDNCSPSNDQCDALSFLFCDPALVKCGCTEPAITVVDSTGECKLRANAPCSPISGTQKCVEQSDCLIVGAPGSYKCTCGKSFISNSIGKCRLPFNSICGMVGQEGDCDAEGFQSCSALNKCSCLDPAQMVFNPQDSVCYFKLGEQCGGSSIKCDPHASLTCGASGRCSCDADLGMIDNGSGVCVKSFGVPCSIEDGQINGGCNAQGHLICENGACACNPSYTAVGQGFLTKCLGNFGAGCASPTECHTAHALVCSGGACQCAIADEQTYDPISKFCLGNVKGRCHLNPTSEFAPWSCAPNLECAISIEVPGLPAGIGRCACAESAGFIEESGKCVKKFGVACTTSEGVNGLCSTNLNLNCLSSGRCGCAPNFSNVTSSDGATKCVGNSLAAPCRTAGDCHGEAGLVCLEDQGHCSCALGSTEMTYDPSSKKCFGNVNGRCHLQVPGGEGSVPWVCDPRLTCLASSDTTTSPNIGRCQCDESSGFTGDGAGGCAKKFGLPCSPSEALNGGCSTRHFLTCSNGVCSCTTNYVEEQEAGGGIGGGGETKCVGLFNAPCTEDSNCRRGSSLTCSVVNQCQCVLPTEQEYDAESRQCYSQRRGRCHLNLNSSSISPENIPLLCDPRLICADSDDWPGLNIGTCVCDPRVIHSSKICSSAGGVGRVSFDLWVALTVVILSVKFVFVN